MVSMLAAVMAMAACATVGPMDNPDDQIRFIWGFKDECIDAMAAHGFNTCIQNFGRYWDFDRGKMRPSFEQGVVAERKQLDHYRELGLGFLEKFTYARDANSVSRWPCVSKDGKKDPKNADAANPEFVETVRKAIGIQARAYADHPAYIGALVDTEMRGHVSPSFTPEMAADYKAYSGREIPAETNGRNPVPWTQIKDFPADRIVPDDYPLLDFYRWQWTKGDGWADWLDVAARSFKEAMGCRPAITMFDPTLRCLSQWRNIGPEISHISNWTYPYPEPYSIAYAIAELQATARGIPGQCIMTSIQSISYRSAIAPIGVHPENEPEWSKRCPKTNYPTTPPDVIQEALWHVFSRRIDGYGTHGWDALVLRKGVDPATHERYLMTNPETFERIGKLFAEVGEPLGPLFRAVPERPSPVAVLESCAAQVLGAHILYSPHHHFSDMMVISITGSLSPYVLYEDEIKERGIPDFVKVIILPKCEVLTRTSFEAIRAFQSRGGRLVADDLLVPALKADAKFVSVEAEARNQQGDFDDGKVRKAMDSVLRDRSVKAAARKLKEACQIESYADSDKIDILVHARSCRDADYVFAINDLRGIGDYVGPWRRLLEKGLPNSGTVRIGREAGAVYDLVKHAPVPFSVKDGKTFVPVDYVTNDGRVFLVVSRPLRDLQYAVDGKTVRVTSPDRDVMIPIRVDGFGRKPFYGVVKDGRWVHEFTSAPGSPVRVSSLATGFPAEEVCGNSPS